MVGLSPARFQSQGLPGGRARLAESPVRHLHDLHNRMEGRASRWSLGRGRVRIGSAAIVPRPVRGGRDGPTLGQAGQEPARSRARDTDGLGHVPAPDAPSRWRADHEEPRGIQLGLRKEPSLAPAHPRRLSARG